MWKKGLIFFPNRANSLESHLKFKYPSILISPFVCLSVYPSVCLFICLSDDLFVFSLVSVSQRKFLHQRMQQLKITPTFTFTFTFTFVGLSLSSLLMTFARNKQLRFH
jgi:hypothetical protein